jgi:3-hydroxybenzoate 6-monooxygenase
VFPDEVEPVGLGYTAYRGLVEREQLAPGLFTADVTLWAGPGYHMMHYPVSSDRLFNIVAVFRSRRFAKGLPDPGGAEELGEIFAAAAPQVRALLELVPTDKHWDISVMEPTSTWTQGRVVMLGDAAHAMLQAMAQGACQAIEDGVWLAEHLQQAGGDCEQAFPAFQQQRQLRAVRMQYQSRLYWEIYHAAGTYARLREEMLHDADEASLQNLAWVYDRPSFAT